MLPGLFSPPAARIPPLTLTVRVNAPLRRFLAQLERPWRLWDGGWRVRPQGASAAELATLRDLGLIDTDRAPLLGEIVRLTPLGRAALRNRSFPWAR